MDATLSTLKACKWAYGILAGCRPCVPSVRAAWAAAGPAGPLFPCACRHLALSSNNIEKISSLAGMDNLQILSLGRNLIKKAREACGLPTASAAMCGA